MILIGSPLTVVSQKTTLNAIVVELFSSNSFETMRDNAIACQEQLKQNSGSDASDITKFAKNAAPSSAQLHRQSLFFSGKSFNQKLSNFSFSHQQSASEWAEAAVLFLGTPRTSLFLEQSLKFTYLTQLKSVLVK